MIDYRTAPDQYRHWTLAIDDRVATLTLSVQEDGGLHEGYALKLNSYDLGVDIELYDAVQRLRFEHPQVGCVVLQSARDRVFCSGANIRMLAGASHAHKVNFCKFTNETRNGIEEASAQSGQRYLAAVNGTAAGGGYEMALATDHIMLIDDGSAAVSLPEVPLLAVLPGTGGLTRVTDKRLVRRDLADVFCTLEEGVRGQRAVQWGLVDETVTGSRFAETVASRAAEFAAASDRPANATGIELTSLPRAIGADKIQYSHLHVALNRDAHTATLTLHCPADPIPQTIDQVIALGCAFWPLALARELDDAILHLRSNEPELGTLLFGTSGDSQQVADYDALLQHHREHWLVREISLYWKRTLKRIDVTSRSLIALVGPGSCYTGFLAELLFAADRSYMLDGEYEGDSRPAPHIRLTRSNIGENHSGPFLMCNDLSRLQTRFYGKPEALEKVAAAVGEALDGARALELGLVTFAPDDLDWDDEIRMLLEERASYSPDALTGLEANLRFPGPETVESKIFARLTAWQNWIFQRPNAVDKNGALQRYGSGTRPDFNFTRV